MTRLWSPAIKDDPEAFVLFAFPWGQENTPLAKYDGPRMWQRQVLRDIKAHIQDNKGKVDMDTLREAYTWLTSADEAKAYQSVALDSISEIAEVVLNAEKKATKDPRQAYGAMQEQMADIIRAFRDLPGRHVYMSAKLEKTQDEMGRVLYAPSMPGNKTGQALPYFFDDVLALRVEKDGEGVTQRALMCDSDGLWLAKDRSGKLEAWEAPDLGAIIAKMQGGK